MIDTHSMHDRLTKGGFSPQQADALISVIQELADVFITREYFDAKLEAEIVKSERRVIGIVLAGVALMLTLFGFIQAVM